MGTREYVIQLMDSLGIGRHYRGYAMAVDAICLVLRNEAELLCMREQVLEPLAVKYDCSWQCVSRNIRTVILRCWQVNAAKLQRMAAYPLTAAPSVTEFIGIVVVYAQRRRLQKSPRAALCGDEAAQECCELCGRRLRQRAVTLREPSGWEQMLLTGWGGKGQLCANTNGIGRLC